MTTSKALSIAKNLAAFLPRFQEKIGVPFVFAGSSAQRVLQPGVKSTRMNPQKAAHRPQREMQAQGNESVLQFASLVEYAAAFFKDISLLGDTSSSFLSRLISSTSSLPLAFDAENFFLHS
ncbi:hypothetical protein ACVIRM_005375 [Rhizobium laguerreae]